MNELESISILKSYVRSIDQLARWDMKLAQELSYWIIQYWIKGIEPPEDANPFMMSAFEQIKEPLNKWRNKGMNAKKDENEIKSKSNQNQNEIKAKSNGDKNKNKIENKNQNQKEKENEKIINHPTDEFDEALNEFVKMRKQIKKPITDKWLELVKEKLNKMYPNNKDLWIKCLYKSIENSWQWVFELKQEDINWYSPPWKKKFIAPDPNKVLSLNEL